MYEMLWIMQMCISSKEIYGIDLYEKRGRMIIRKKKGYWLIFLDEKEIIIYKSKCS